MAPTRKLKTKFWKYLDPVRLLHLVKILLFDHNYLWAIGSILLVAEVFVNVLVVHYVNYTEIDWKAYMSEVEGFLNGTYDYMKLEGGTGPLVYPAGFVYFYSGLYYITGRGGNVRLAQYLFIVFYLLTLAMVFYIYNKTRVVPPYMLFFICCTSYRIHSIFVLRLFNDPVAMMFLYAGIVFFLKDHWTTGCIFFSLGVSIKMNILLFSPGLFVLLFIRFGALGTIKNICVCATLQIVLAMPFLMENSLGYIARSFNLGRQFFFIWTVNWRFLPEDIFQSRVFHVVLLALHCTTLLFFFLTLWPKPIHSFWGVFLWKGRALTSREIVYVLFTSNLVGVMFARSLHYQFYVWYFHTLPVLLWSVDVQPVTRLLVLGLVEMSWNTYPSTNLSSASLHCCHGFILIGMYLWNSSKLNVKATISEQKSN